MSQCKATRGKSQKILKMWRLTCFFVLVANLYGSCTADSESAHLLVSKQVLNEYIVEGRDLTVSYAIYNVGSSSATSVSLVEETFKSDEFEVVHGQVSVRWQSIAPGANVSHNIILKPLGPGIFNITPAMVTYEPKEGAEQQVAFSTAFGETFIMNAKEFNRKHSPHVMDWGIFALMTIPTIVLPYAIWYSTHSKYEALKPKKM